MLTYTEAVEYLDSFVDYERIGFEGLKEKIDLDKLREVLEKLGNPHHDYRSVHIAGTKGKGSVCTFASSILEEAGYRVGLFTSPHLTSPRERIKVNSRDIVKKDLIRAAERLRNALGPASEKDFTFFEVYTLMAILYFSLREVDFAVFETGMGGRLDATNVIDAEVCGITPISYDHMEVLGGSIQEIAREKAAIIKNGSHCVISPQVGEVLDIIKERCAGEKASLSLVGEDIAYKTSSSNEKGSRFDISTELRIYKNCWTNMLGDFQVSNCAAAVGICEKLLGDKGVGKSVLKKGIRRAFIPGRMEILSRKPLIVIDGAQNGDSAEKLKYSVEQIFKYDRLILLLGLSRGKDVKEVCRQLVPLADEIILTRSSGERAMDPRLIRGYIKHKHVNITGDVKEALGKAFELAGENDMILATGSFFVISEILYRVRKAEGTRYKHDLGTLAKLNS